MAKKLYVGNLLYEVTDDQLRDHFSQAGAVVSAQVIRFADSGRSKGFGFVEMESEEDAQKAIEMFSEQDFLGRNIIVNEARPKTEGGNRSFGGGRGRFNRDSNRRFGGNDGGGRGRFDRGNRDENRGNDMRNESRDVNNDMSMDVDLGMDQD